MTTVSSTTDVSTTKEATDLSTQPYVRPSIGRARKALLLWLFCGAEFMDAFIASALFPAINVLQKDLDIGDADITWAFSAYSATFAAFLLISGRVADVYSARESHASSVCQLAVLMTWPPSLGICFIVGCVILGTFSLGGGFAQTKIGLFILRAFAGRLCFGEPRFLRVLNFHLRRCV